MIMHTADHVTVAGMPVVPAIILATSAVLYFRGSRSTRDVSRPVAFIAAWIVLAFALLSPLHEAGEEFLSFHMAQHVLLMAVAAPLLVWSAPVGALLRGLPRPLRNAGVAIIRVVAPVRRRLSTLTAACLLQMAVLWAWHFPALYQASVENSWIHAFQHSTLMVASILFWMSLPLRRAAHDRILGGIASLFFTSLQMGLLSALFTFSRLPWYPVYVTHGAAAAINDQQVAGLIMWVPGAIPYVIAALSLVWKLMRRREWHAPLIVNQPIARALVLFVAITATMSVSACDRRSAYEEGSYIAHGNPRHGLALIKGYGCAACHIIPGAPGGRANIGPNLVHFRNRMYIGGVMPNSPENLQKWIEDPKSVDTLTAMPNLGVSPTVARDIASYLYSLK